MIGFILGSMFGGTVGVFAMCLCRTASESDMHMNNDTSAPRDIYTDIK
ncbi:MAG TPA: DUF3789 domain-containing protein [Ruminococcus sp.]|nr:DUF3789 domain-containing protein [Ruminococcus sp.]